MRTESENYLVVQKNKSIFALKNRPLHAGIIQIFLQHKTFVSYKGACKFCQQLAQECTKLIKAGL